MRVQVNESGQSYVRGRVRGQRVLVARPAVSDPGDLSTDVLSVLARAKVEGMAACLLPSRADQAQALFALVPSNVPLATPGVARRAGLAARWRVATAAARARAAVRSAWAAVCLELSRELRRGMADETIARDLRLRMRDLAQRTLTAGERANAGPVRTLPRRLLREPVAMTLPPALLVGAREDARLVGLSPEARIVVIEAHGRAAALGRAMEFLQGEGYTVVRLGAPIGRAPAGVVDLPARLDALPLVAVYALLTARFVVCASNELQRVACLTATPSLTLNAPDPFAAYPVRRGDLFVLKQAIDLDTGRALTAGDRMTEWYYRNLRNCGYRDNTAEEILFAVREMHEAAAGRARETESQAQFRMRATDAGARLAKRNSYVAEWGPDDGFLGDGCLVRFQADRDA